MKVKYPLAFTIGISTTAFSLVLLVMLGASQADGYTERASAFWISMIMGMIAMGFSVSEEDKS
jgi:hypothetical protein